MRHDQPVYLHYVMRFTVLLKGVAKRFVKENDVVVNGLWNADNRQRPEILRVKKTKKAHEKRGKPERNHRKQSETAWKFLAAFVLLYFQVFWTICFESASWSSAKLLPFRFPKSRINHKWIWRREKRMTMDDRWWPEDSRNSEVFWGFGMPLFLAAWKSLFAAAWLQLSALKSMTKLAYTGWPEYRHHLRWKASEISGMSPKSKESWCISTHKAQWVWHVDPLLLQPQSCEVVRDQNAWRWKWETWTGQGSCQDLPCHHDQPHTETKRKAGATELHCFQELHLHSKAPCL